MESKSCQNCTKEFNIESDDFSFYEKVKVPPPTWCPACRMTRRLAFGNIWGVHFRNCDKCGKKTLTMYRPDSPTKVFCDPCWWADDWDGTEYGVDYDPSRNFLEQWRELRDKTPHFAKDALYMSLKDCEYTNSIAYSKNCYLTFWADYCENVYHSSLLNTAKDCLDSARIYQSELCYETVDSGYSSKVYFSLECDNCVDVWFSRNCDGCMNCVGCANQRNKNYMIFNEQYTREGYLVKLKELNLNTRNGLEEMLKKSVDLWRTLPYREYRGNSQNLNVSGDSLFGCKNAKDCYMCSGVEDSRYVQFVSVPKASNCMDYYGWGNNANFVYEAAATGENATNVKFCYGIFGSSLDVEYSGFSIGGKNNFGCANLKRKQYCILNKQYSKEEYEKLRERIIEDMSKNPYIDSKGRAYSYGEFFPPEFSLFPYTDSTAARFAEKTKDEALKEGYIWEDREEQVYQKTLNGNNLPQSILETEETITKEIIECNTCKKCYRIAPGEFVLCQKLGVPIPANCPKCREKRRFALINKPHDSHKTNCDNCKKEIGTMYNPSSGKIIYCVSCYQQLFV